MEATLLGSLVDLWNLLLSDVSPRAPRWAGDKTTHLSPMSETGGATSHPVPPGLFGLNMARLLGIFGSITPSQPLPAWHWADRSGKVLAINHSSE